LVKFADIIEHLWKCCCRVVGLDRRFKEWWRPSNR
jgi:hypothetical protein